MPSIYDLKPRFQALLRPTIRRLHSAGLTPNHITSAALVGSLAAGIAVAFARQRPALLLVLPIWLFVRMALNAIDGMMARELSLSSTLGAVLNEVGDVVSDIAIYLPLALFSAAAGWAVVIFVVVAVLTEFCGVLAQALGAARHYEGPMGKSDRAFIVGAIALVTVIAPRTVHAWPWLFWAAAVLAGITCLNRLRASLAEIRGEKA